jgi:hypothetical protein
VVGDGILAALHPAAAGDEFASVGAGGAHEGAIIAEA